jgi:hypothetical protein
VRLALTAGCTLSIGSRLEPHTMFLFFSNKLGCLGSILVSLVVTLLLLLALGWL